MLIGTDFLWKAVTVKKLRELLDELPDDDWVYADRNDDLAIVSAESFREEKNQAYPGDRVVDLMNECVRPAKKAP